jgi:glycosyltransferase involved in cell wall biosynthesis
MSLTIFSKKIIIDIHDIYALDNSNYNINNIFNFLYCNFVTAVIIHAYRNKELLKKIGYKNKILEVPHFKYNLNKIYLIDNIGTDVKQLIKNKKINILFFGNMRLSKGIDILSDAFCSMPDNSQKKYNIIIAGNDSRNILVKYAIYNNENTSVVRRYINDDELIYLFSCINYVIFPYREISQSGVLEMAFCFRKPILASHILYFEHLLQRFPSFGLLFEGNADNLAEMLNVLPDLSNNFYTEQDILDFEERDKIESFKKDFSTFIQCHKMA